MFLRSLTLKGFKSFAEATTLELEPGLTVVVGPNGSGKSNIVDAVAWVLGAQGPRTVRSQRMEDVIFAGSGKRSALGRAEVALTIDNSAGLLPIGFTEVTLTRTLFRASGESEYAINGVPCRLLDLQELLSDTGVGRQQHVIVSQGNLDQVLDVRPEDRRLIVEEAAGILKFRRRKEKAERRLEATESHLVRLSDLLKELRRGMRPLERQADAALRHDGLAAELRALSVYLSGRTLAGLTARAEAGARELARFGRDETAALAELRRLDGDISTLEARLAPMGGGALDGAAARLEALRERARGVGAVLAERARSLAAEVAAAEGGDLGLDPLARLEADAVTLAGELSAAEEEAARLEDAASTLAEAEAELAARRARLAARQAAEATRRRAAEARGELAALAASAERARVELAAVEARLADLDKVVAEAEDKVTAAREVRGAAAARRADVTAALAHARAGATEAAARRAAALAARQRAERAADAATARVEALSLSVTAADPPHAGPAGGPVGLGTLLALVRIEAGWEAAVEAALGDALTAVVMSGPADVRAALAAFESAGRPGPPTAYLPAALGPGVGAATAPEAVPGAVPLVGKVASADRAVAALLERLLAGAVAVDGGWEAALAVAEARPDLCAVTRAGDRFGPGGWKLAGEAPSLAAALAAARQRADEAVAAAIEARAAEEQAAAEAEAATAAADEQAAAAEVCREAMATGAATLAAAEADLRQAQAAAATERAQRASVAARVSEDEKRAANLDSQLSLPLAAPEAPGSTGDGVPADLDTERDDVAWEGQALAARRAQITAQSDALAARQADLRGRLRDGEARMEALRAARSQAEVRAGRSRTDLTHVRRLSAAVEAVSSTIDEHLADLEERRRRRAAATRELSARLASARQLRADTERSLEECRAAARRTEIEGAETRLRLETAVEALRRDLDCEPEQAMAAECPPLPAGTSAGTRAREVEREIRLLGPVNPLAVEELTALREREEFLTTEIDDVKTTRRDLARVIRSVEAEMTGLLAAAYADVAENFVSLFETLFPGGEGRLRLTDPEHILESGVEIEARPGGKSARKLSLLSGGERSLCAMAFLFAVFRSRPSPFYLLDEVEAALDDVNLHRFLRLLDEFRAEAQLVVVSHQKRTMEAADCLFGVTMAPGGSSRVLSERVTTTA